MAFSEQQKKLLALQRKIRYECVNGVDVFISAHVGTLMKGPNWTVKDLDRALQKSAKEVHDITLASFLCDKGFIAFAVSNHIVRVQDPNYKRLIRIGFTKDMALFTVETSYVDRVTHVDVLDLIKVHSKSDLVACLNQIFKR